jgi:hypothetical protein
MDEQVEVSESNFDLQVGWLKVNLGLIFFSWRFGQQENKTLLWTFGASSALTAWQMAPLLHISSDTRWRQTLSHLL